MQSGRVTVGCNLRLCRWLVLILLKTQLFGGLGGCEGASTTSLAEVAISFVLRLLVFRKLGVHDVDLFNYN